VSFLQHQHLGEKERPMMAVFLYFKKNDKYLICIYNAEFYLPLSAAVFSLVGISIRHYYHPYVIFFTFTKIFFLGQ